MKDWNMRLLVAIIGTLLGGAITSGLMYVTVVSQYVSKSEVRHMISNESPYLRDQKWLTESVRSFDFRLGKMDEKLDLVLKHLEQ